MEIARFERYMKEPRLLHGGDYNPDQWLNHPQILQDDITFMKEVKANAFSVGIFAWAALEPQEGVFNFDWLDKVINDIHSIGGNVILATPSGARPAWLSQKYPEVLRTNSRNEKMLHGNRHNHCFSSPIYREKIGIMNRKLAERYKNHPAILMWHVSNEYSGECYCEYCKSYFRKWIQEKYVTLDALNHTYWSAFWSHTYTCFSQVEPPSPIGENSVHALTLDWMRFITHQTIDFYRHEIAPLRELSPHIPITTNFMSDMVTPYPFSGLNYAPFAKEVDIISWDAYPAWHNDYETTEFLASKLAFLNDYYRSLKDQPFLILESTPSMVNWQPVNKAKRPGMHMLSSVAKLAHGADSVMYFQWRKSRGSFEKFHGAVVDHDNSSENRVFKDVAVVGEMLEKVAEVKNSTTPAKVAILYDMECQWALDDIEGFSRQTRKYPQTVHAHYKAFWDKNIPVDVITPGKDLCKYALVVAPMLYMVSEELADELEKYVSGGGMLVSTYLSGLADKNDLVYEGGFNKTFRKIFGVSVTETDTLYPSQKNSIVGFAGGKEYEIQEYCALVECHGAKALGTYTKDFYHSTPVVTRNDYGHGQAYFIGARTNADFLKSFYNQILTEELTLNNVNSPPVKAPPGVSVQTRTSESINYYFIMNFTEEERSVTLEHNMHDLITGQNMPKGEYKMPVYGVYICKDYKS